MQVDEKIIKQLRLITRLLLFLNIGLIYIVLYFGFSEGNPNHLQPDSDNGLVYNKSLINLAIFVGCFFCAMYYFKYFFNSKIADSLIGSKLIINNGDKNEVNSTRLIKGIMVYYLLFMGPCYYASTVMLIVSFTGIGSQNYLYWLNIIPMFYSIFMVYQNYPNKAKLEGLITTYYPIHDEK